MSIEARMTITNMAIEAGAKNGVIGFDDITREYLDGRLKDPTPYTLFQSDPDANYAGVTRIDCSRLEPIVAFPHLPSGGKPISECAGLPMDQAYIGSCTNGRIEDLRIAADVLRGRQVKIRTIVVPATPRVWRQCVDEGLAQVFDDAGCVVSAPTCGACLGGFMGILAEGDAVRKHDESQLRRADGPRPQAKSIWPVRRRPPPAPSKAGWPTHAPISLESYGNRHGHGSRLSARSRQHG